MTPVLALRYLAEGHRRFVGNLEASRNLLERLNGTRDGRWPSAVIPSCIDRRTTGSVEFLDDALLAGGATFRGPAVILASSDT